MAARRRSLLEDESVVEVKGRDEASEGDVCTCGHERAKHLDDGACLKCKCDQFEE